MVLGQRKQSWPGSGSVSSWLVLKVLLLDVAFWPRQAWCFWQKMGMAKGIFSIRFLCCVVAASFVFKKWQKKEVLKSAVSSFLVVWTEKFWMPTARWGLREWALLSSAAKCDLCACCYCLVLTEKGAQKTAMCEYKAWLWDVVAWWQCTFFQNPSN